MILKIWNRFNLFLVKGKGSVWTALIFVYQRPYQNWIYWNNIKLNTLVHKWRDVVGDVIAGAYKNCVYQASRYGD